MNNALVIWKVTQAIDYFEGNGRRKAMIMKLVAALAISSCTTDRNYSNYFEGNGRRKAMIMKIVAALVISSCTTDWNYSDTVSIIFCMNMMKTTV